MSYLPEHGILSELAGRNAQYKKAPSLDEAFGARTPGYPAVRSLRSVGPGSDRNDTYVFPASGPFDFELHGAVYGGEDRVILAKANVHTGMEVCATLTHKDVACENSLTAESLDTESL